MADASVIKLAKDQQDPNAAYANFYKRLRLSSLPLVPGTRYYYLDIDFSCDRYVYLYLALVGNDVDIDITLLRSAGVTDTNVEYAVEIPGGTATITTAASATAKSPTDFQFDSFGADRLWIKVDTPLGITRGALDVGFLLIKQDK